MTSVYLAGAITGKSFEQAVEWREAVSEILTAHGFEVRSPMREKLHLKSEFDDRPLPMAHHSFVDPFPRDTLDIRQSDIILTLLEAGDPPSVGTLVEIGYAKGLGKFNVMVAESEWAQNHPFTKGCADYAAPDLADAVDYIIKTLPLAA